MLRRFVGLLLMALIAAPMATADTPKAEPVDEAAQDQTFAAYRDRLLDAVVRRDIDAILGMVAEDIALSFGGDAGRDRLRARFTVDPETIAEEYRHTAPNLREDYWAAFETVLRMGGRFGEDGNTFSAPYTWTAKVPPGYDPFETYFVTGSGVTLRDRPIRYGKPVGALSHDIVTVLDGGEGTDYRRVRTADGQEGYAHLDYLRSQVDYRAIFVRRDGEWRLERFIAGD